MTNNAFISTLTSRTAWGLAMLLTTAVSGQAQDRPDSRGGWSIGVMAGVMTTNDLAGLARGSVEVTDSGLAGVFLAWDRPLDFDPRWSLGFEFQVNTHFGDGHLLEFALPVTIRYAPTRPWWTYIDSYAFGMGLSVTDQIPSVEIDTYGASQTALVYLMAETAFDVGGPDDTVFLRIHHRSDGYGLFETDSGSNALTIGYRRSF